MIYLAIPYTHENSFVEHCRFDVANHIASALMKEGIHVFSPISHSHPIRIKGGLPGGWEYWEEYDRKMLSVCTKLFVVCIPGWMESKGVRAEIEIAEALCLPIMYYHPLDTDNTFSDLTKLLEGLKA